MSANGKVPWGGAQLLYAPRSLEEVEIVMRIVGAGIGWRAGMRVECTKGMVVEKKLAVKVMKGWADLDEERGRVWYCALVVDVHKNIIIYFKTKQ